MSKIEKTEEMFCYQCEQRAGCSGCTGARGVCGKSSKTALLQDKLTGSLVALAELMHADYDAIYAVKDGSYCELQKNEDK